MTKKEKEALKDCDDVFINLEDMMSEESANKYRKSYRIIKKIIKNQQKEIEYLKEVKCYYEISRISKDKIKEKLEIERIKALDRFDNKLDVTQRIYKRNVQVALIDKLKKELLKEE